MPPLEDRHLALALLCELSVQKALLSEMLATVLLLLNLWGSRQGGPGDDNRLSLEASSAPLVNLLKRLEDVPSVQGEEEDDEDSQQPTQCFLEYLSYPEDETSPIDLQQTAVGVMAHLDRMARPLLREVGESQPRVRQGITVWGERAGEIRDLVTTHGLVSAAWGAGGCLHWVTALGSVHSLHGGRIETVDTAIIADRDSRVVEVVCTQGQLTVLTSMGELWTMDSGDTRLNLVTGLLTRRVTQVAGGEHHLAAVTDQGQVFTWTEDSVSPVQVTFLITSLLILWRTSIIRSPL